MELIKEIHSKKDNTIKYIYSSNNYIFEFSLIDKNDGKDIVCVPCATTCNLGCKFCHLTGLNIKLKNLANYDIYKPVDNIISKLYFDKQENKIPNNKVLLISYMGCGEPLYNIYNVIESAYTIEYVWDIHYKVVRFAVASLIPTHSLFKRFTKEVKKANLKCKFHYSLHTTNNELRKELMPGTSPICIDLIQNYMQETGNAAEVHYSLMDNINDRDNDAKSLGKLLQGTNINAKLLKFNEKQGQDLSGSNRILEFKKILEDYDVVTEFYDPPGSDIGSSCGQFLMDYYKENND